MAVNLNTNASAYPQTTGGSGRDSVDSKEKINTMMPQLKEASEKTGVPLDRLAATMIQESRGVSINDMTNKNNGLMQLSEAKFDELKGRYPDLLGNKTWNSPEGQIMGAALFLKEMKEKAGDWDGASALYNGGENSGGKLNDPNYVNSMHETIYDIDNNLPIPS